MSSKDATIAANRFGLGARVGDLRASPMMVNGSGGTDHGSGGAVFLYGGAVVVGKVMTDWPGLARGVSRSGADLTPTVAVWAVLKGVLRDHFGMDGNTLDEFVFPDSRNTKPLDGLLRR
jgi:uncharacterized protein (DUF1501 family)